MKMKKLLAAFLSAAMAVTSAAIPVFADETAPEEAPIETVEEAPVEEVNDDVPVEEDIELAEESDPSEATPCPWEGQGTVEKPYLIKTADDLRDLANAVNSQSISQENKMFKGKYFKMTQDIVLDCDKSNEDTKWKPIGMWKEMYKYKAFCGTFDGDGHAIKNLWIERNDSYNGIFGYIRDGAVIKNLSVHGSIKGTTSTGGIVGCVDDECIILNCHNYCNITCGGESGGIAGRLKSATNTKVTDCHNQGNITTDGGVGVGGIVGTAGNTVYITNCYNTGKITKTGSSEGLGGIVGKGKGIITKCYNAGEITGPKSAIGGIVGYGEAGTEIDSCYNTAEIKATANDTNCVGGIIGDGSRGVYKIANCYNEGKIIGAGTSVGGIAGYVVGRWTTKTPMEKCENSAPVSGAKNVGGIAGRMESMEVQYCSNSGKVSGTGNYVGGIYGIDDNSGGCRTIGCCNTAEVSGAAYVGGIGGALANNSSYIQHNYNLGKVTGTGEYVGGIVGHDDSLKTTGYSDKISYCFNAGEVKTGADYTPGGVIGTGTFNNTAGDKKVVTNTFYKKGTAEHGYVPTEGNANDVDGQIQVFGTYSELKGKLPSSEWYFEADENEPPQLVKNPRPMPRKIKIIAAEGGSVTASVGETTPATTAMKRDVVTLTVSTNEGYKFSNIKVISGGKAIDLTENKDGTYTFTMPDADVTVSAAFLKDGTHTFVDTPPIVDAPSVPKDVFGTDVPEDAFNGWSAEFSDESIAELNALRDPIDKNDNLYDKAKEQLTKEGEDPPTDVYIHVVTDLELTVENYDSETKTLTVDVSAILHTIATTIENPTDAQLEHPEPGTNVVEIRPERVIPINNTVTIVLPLPAALYKDVPSVDVRHIHNGKTTKKTVDNINNSATVTVDGLSEFIISPTAEESPSWEVIAGEHILTGDGRADVPNNITSATITGMGVTATVNGETVAFTDGSADVDLQPGENVIVIQNGGETHTITITREELKSMSVYFKKSSDDEHKYDIILKAGNGMAGDDAKQTDGIINRLNSADLTFELTPADGDVSYTITPAGYIDLIDAGSGRYEFNFKEGDDKHNTDNEIVIGTVEFFGYGTISFGVKELTSDADTNVVHPTKGFNSIVDEYTPEGNAEKTGALNIKAADFDDVYGAQYEGKIKDLEITAETGLLTINVMFPNTVLKQSADYTDMTISLHSALDAKHKIEDIKLGTVSGEDGAAKYTPAGEGGTYAQYTLTQEVLTDTRYTVTFTGAGYREYAVDVVIPKNAKNASVTVWNNVMDGEHAMNVVTVGDTAQGTAVVKTFLAGDIVKDEEINLYDLSAVVAYFGRDKLIDAATGAPAADMEDYVQYDLNRDGQIDSKDIAMILVSWGK